MAIEKGHYFYVLCCADQSFYAGYATDWQRREDEHNGIGPRDKGAKYTRYRRPVQVVLTENYATRSQAQQAEAAFKRLSREQKQRYLATRGVVNKQVVHLTIKD